MAPKAPSYRQIVQLVFNKARAALRVLDDTEESLISGQTKNVDVSTTVLPVTSFFELDGTERKAIFQVLSGGPVNFNTTTPPDAAGTDGDLQAQANDIIVVRGYEDIERIGFVLQTGGATAEIRAMSFRRA